MPSIEELKAAAEALNRSEVRKELTKEDDVKNVMKQIMDMALPLKLPAGGGEPAATPQPELSDSAVAPPLAVPAPPADPPKPPPWLHNIVQVVSKEGRHFGRIFQLGDIKDGKAHGYIIKEHGALEHITVPSDHVATIGAARIRSKFPCSDRWISEQMG